MDIKSSFGVRIYGEVRIWKYDTMLFTLFNQLLYKKIKKKNDQSPKISNDEKN